MEQQGIEASAAGCPSSAPSGSPVEADAALAEDSGATLCSGPAVILHADWRRELRRAIVKGVLPRLSLSGGPSPHCSAANRATPFTAEVVADFADEAITADVGRLLAAIDGFLADGASLESVFIDLLSPAARRLGDLWLADRMSFFHVTLGLGHLQAVVRILGPRFDRFSARSGPGGRILLCPVSGEQHVFGLSIVAAFFRRAGWVVTFEPAGITDALMAGMAAGGFDAVGLSAAGDGAVARLPGLVQAIRRAAGSRGIAVLAGGPAFLADPELCRRSGADAFACDATEAVRIAEAFQRRAAAA